MNKLSIIFFLGLITFTSCDNSEEQSEPTLRDKLSQTWQLTDAGYVKSNGIIVTDMFTDLSFTFHIDGTYSSSVNTKITDGVWRATDSSISTIILDEVTPVNILELTESTLLISFTHEGMINGKSKGVSTFEILLMAE